MELFLSKEWFWYSGVYGNIQGLISPGFRRCASRHSSIHLKIAQFLKPGAIKGAQTFLKLAAKLL